MVWPFVEQQHRRDAWRAQAVAWTMAGGLLSGCATPKAACDNCLPPKPATLHYDACCDQLVTKQTAHQCAYKDLHRLKKECGRVSHDFSAGFHQAYEDLALGRYAAVPPVPPSKYWNAYYRSCAGQEAVQDWFTGYRTGLDVGRQSGVSRFNRVVSSGAAGDGVGNGIVSGEW